MFSWTPFTKNGRDSRQPRHLESLPPGVKSNQKWVRMQRSGPCKANPPAGSGRPAQFCPDTCIASGAGHIDCLAAARFGHCCGVHVPGAFHGQDLCIQALSQKPGGNEVIKPGRGRRGELTTPTRTKGVGELAKRHKKGRGQQGRNTPVAAEKEREGLRER